MILNLPALDNVRKNLKAMGVKDADDMTNLIAIMARAFEKSMTGDVGAMRFLLEMANITPAQKFAEKQYKDKMKKPQTEKDEAIQKLEEVLEEIKSGF
ncbi:MAG: hypothetical protein IKP95_09325 [Ruminococcus sp.]|nr:hypothetical protein [Ruminococcus sp.]